MSIFSPLDCRTGRAHLCSPCPAIEGGRIRHAAFVSTAFLFSDYEDPSDWLVGISQGLITVIPNINGVIDMQAVRQKSYGSLPERILYYEYTVNVSDAVLNHTLYNYLSQNQNYRLAWCSETQVQISSKAVTTIAKDPIDSSVESERVSELEISWWQYSPSITYNIPVSIFACQESPTQYLLTEAGEYLLTESGERIIL